MSDPPTPERRVPDPLTDELFAPIEVNGRFRLDGSVAVVTGASSGLGLRFARVLHGAGAAVVVGARRLDRLDVLAGAHTNMEAVCCDVTDEDDRGALIDRAAALAAQTGRTFDVLVNNAGISETIRALDEPLERFREVIDVNLTSLFRLCQLAGTHFVGQGTGSIVNVASMLGLVASAPIPQASYVASKGAVVSLTRELGCQWARKGVRVNAIAPGWFPSEMTGDKMLADEHSMEFLRRNCPMARAGADDELDGVLLLLAGSAGSYITGQTLTVDGGWTAR